MKYIKFLAFLMAVVSLSACGDNDDKVDYNTAKGVTVSMKFADFNTMESRGIINVPFEVKGEANGYVTVTCQVEEVGENPAMADVHYYVTDETVNVADGDSEGNFEIRLVDDREINDGRTFIIKIVDVQGATVEGMAQTTVFIDDNDDKPYDRLAGEWYCVYANDIGDEPTSKKITINAYAPDDYGYGYSYLIDGLIGDGEQQVQMMFHYEEATKEGDCAITLPQTYKIEGVDGTWELGFLTDDWAPITSGKAVFTWNEDVSELYLVSSPGGSDHVNFIIWNSSTYQLYDYTLEVTRFTRDQPQF